MTYTFDADIVSDLHKDAFGRRPSEGFWDRWNSGDDDQKQEMWDDLLVDLGRGMAWHGQSEGCVR